MARATITAMQARQRASIRLSALIPISQDPEWKKCGMRRKSGILCQLSDFGHLLRRTIR
jgi:hypothetical protein